MPKGASSTCGRNGEHFSLLGANLLGRRGQFVGPLLRTVQYAKNSQGVSNCRIGGDLRRAGNHQLTRSCDSAIAAHIWELRQTFNTLLNAVIDGNGSPRAICLNVIENSFAVG
jgi:hypothetical protein